MPWDAQDRTRYEDEVLVAARAHGLPANPFTRYGVDSRLERRLRADPGAFTAHVTEVCAHWRTLRDSRRSLRKVLTDLITEHERLEGEGALTYSHFHRMREEAARRALAEWSEIAESLTTAMVDRDTFRSMIAPVGVSETDAERVLLDRGVHVVERLPELPDAPRLRAFRALRENLRARGLAFSPMVVFGEERLAEGFTVLDGFRLHDGTPLDKTALDEAVQRVRSEETAEHRIASENVLESLRADGDEALREALVLWEVVSDMREQPTSVTESELVRTWAARGLFENEAMLLAATVRRSGPRSEPSAHTERSVRDLLVDNRLRQAQEAAEDLPEDHDLHARLRVRMRQVEELTGEADRALRAGDREEAARALAAAVDVAADDEGLAARLGEVEPLPPRGAEARVEGRSVVVTWRPSPSVAGALTYRVSRRTGRDGKTREVPVGESSGTEITDAGAPVGSEVHYTVVAVRGGRGVSEAVSTPPVVIAPEVHALRVYAGEREVCGTWEAPAEAVRVEVLRGEGSPPRGPGDGVRVETDGAGFRDTDVQTDVEYHYRIRAVYVTSNGHARGSVGLVRRASPGPCPDPVLDLEVRPSDGTEFVASWTSPPRGRVALWVGTEPPPWEPGTAVGPEELNAYGREVAQRPMAEDVRGRAGVTGHAGAGIIAATGGTGPARAARQPRMPHEEREGVRLLGPDDEGEVAVRNSRPPTTDPPAEVFGKTGGGQREGVRILDPSEQKEAAEVDDAEDTGEPTGAPAPRGADPFLTAPAPGSADKDPVSSASQRPAPASPGQEQAPPVPRGETSCAPPEEDPGDWEGIRILGPQDKAETGAGADSAHVTPPPGPEVATTNGRGSAPSPASEEPAAGRLTERATPAGPRPGTGVGGHSPIDSPITSETGSPTTDEPAEAAAPSPATSDAPGSSSVKDGSGPAPRTPGALWAGTAGRAERGPTSVPRPATSQGKGGEPGGEHVRPGPAHVPEPGRPWAPRDRTSHTRTARPQTVRPEPPRARAAVTLDSGTNHVVAVTVAGDQTVVGSHVRVVAAPPVRDLHAQRFDTTIRLGWTWPDDAASALISWRPEVPGSEPWIGGELRCTRHQYASDGGFEAPMGPDSVHVAVRAVVPFEGGEAVSSPVDVIVPGRAVLDYRVEAAGLLRRDRVIHVLAEEDCDMPELAVIYSEGPVQPHSAAQGVVLAIFPAQRLEAGAWLSVRVRPPRGTGEGWLMCFPTDDTDHTIRLRQPPVKELRC
ncbi:hypothetical protein [Nocardiopsis sp. ATB16-24]|uniref:hypothetical protein n=1 Tax=Nocardiopsis sp. ATB16-24 TaxID=3019555 RepID=UPI002557268F|nr:hypothetical protein [Nocardiopsis sp. ATB16-24]